MGKTFIFDLDGTVTAQETIPVIARHYGLSSEIEELTRKTVAGKLPFAESLAHRVSLLGHFPADEVSDLLCSVPVYPMVRRFIRERNTECCVATGHLEQWVGKLVTGLGCELFASQGTVECGKVTGLASVLEKESVVARFQSLGHSVIFIGDGHNDADAMKLADVGIAAGMTHCPAESVLAVADHVVYSENVLYSLLRTLAND